MHNVYKQLIAMILFCVVTVFSQTEQFIPDSIARADFWHLNNKTSLFVGSTFYYMNPSDSIVVSLESSESDAVGELYCMVPGFKDSALFLFTNKQNGARVNITKAINKQIPPGTEIFFMYKRVNTQKNMRFTGRNRVGIDPQDQSIYPGASFVSREFGLRPGFGHRWAVAGRILDSLSNKTDTIIFGFEDDGIIPNPQKDSLVAADFDFNDVIFKVTGLNLNVEPVPDSLVIDIANDTVHAGDSVICKAQVWADSAGRKVKTSRYDSLLIWKFEGDALHHDTLICHKSGDTSVTFLPRTAYKQFKITVTLKSPINNETLSIAKDIYVLPGEPRQISIELKADTGNSGFSFNYPVEISRVQIASNETKVSMYAILRDIFGNFVDFSHKVKWDTTYASLVYPLSNVAVVKSGNSDLGEGVVEKINSGNIKVFVSDSFGLEKLNDTVLINVASVSYDSIRIGVYDGQIVYNLDVNMTTDSCRQFIAEGLRADNGKWENVNVIWSTDKWSLSNSLAQSQLNFCPADTGNGYIKAEYSGYIVAKKVLKVNPGAPASLVLYTDQNSKFNQDTTVPAGIPIRLQSKFFDKHGVLVNISKKDSIKWNVIELSSDLTVGRSGTVSNTTGDNVIFTPVYAQRTVRVIAKYGDLSDSIDLNIVPGKPYRVVIESHADWQKSKYVPSEIDTIELPNNKTTTLVYALIRDSIGNYIDSMRAGLWTVNDTIVNVNTGKAECICQINKNLQITNGVCLLRVESNGLKDSAVVKVIPYHYTALRINTANKINLDTLIISTNDDTTLYVQALRSDTAIWKEIPADWSITNTLSVSTQVPSYSSQFAVSPNKPAAGFIKAKNATITDSIYTVFTRGAPVRAELSIVAMSQELIAGDTIKCVARIYNKDGLVPGSYSFTKDSLSGGSKFFDTLHAKNEKIRSTVTSGGQKSFVNISPDSTFSISETFKDGVDTVKFVLYFAPFGADSLHQLSVHLGKLVAIAPAFRLKPSILDHIVISHSHTCCPDTLVMKYPTDEVLLFAIGYDKFSNMIGGEACNWSTTGSLHHFVKHKPQSRIVYNVDTLTVKDDEYGVIVATSAAKSGIKDSLYVKIIGPLAVPISAITRDNNGNGCIDMIEIKFSMPIYTINTKVLNSCVNIQYQSVAFPVDHIKISADSMVMDVYIKETQISELQTDWKPTIVLDNSQNILGNTINFYTIETNDGIGPVIASVRKDLDKNSRKNDLVTVKFSEDIYGADGNRFSLLQVPEKVFTTWLLTSSGQYDHVNLLTGIQYFNSPYYPDQLYFTTTNGIELTNKNYFSLRTDSTAYTIKDADGNKPSIYNRKVAVEVYGDVEKSLTIAPNPGTPTCVREKPGEFHLRNNPAAYEWIRHDKGGIAISFQITIPDKSTSIGGRITIYDAVGNVVASDPYVYYTFKNLVQDGAFISEDVRWNINPSNWKADGTVYNYTIYWNGFTKNGMRVAPGIYKAVLSLHVKSNSKDNVTVYREIIGINR